jgi:arylsulfatase A-like enzyme
LVQHPIVILFVVDCMRADVLENVDGGASLPTMFALRDASVNFAQARTMAPSTTQSIAALMASKAYSQMYWTSIQNGRGDTRIFPAEDTSKRFPEVLTAAGVSTILSTPLSGLTSKLGVLRGVTEEYIHPKLTAPAAVLAAGVNKRLKTINAEPVFFYVHVTDAHAPWPHSGPNGSPWQRYLRGLEKIDAALASINRAIKGAGLAERTVLILTADHGEAFGEHGDRFHGHSLYDEVLRVPLLVRVPGLPPRKIDDIVSLGDLAPTILDIFGLPSPGAFTGQSLVGLLRGDTAPLMRPVVAESTRYKRAMIFPNGMKVIEDRRIGIFELFDLKKDPGELINLLDGEKQTPSSCSELGFLQAFFAAHEFKSPGYTLPYQR